ncbi:MAG: carbamoyl-phosphate synthase small subunit [Sphingobium sp.]|uniref:glutamine-hydrolyzing carbamoyl-phosphate synthase small subunit n=1 Tax=Sphingobium TaxID=165695 RepID=UPI000399A00D|nr:MULTISPECIES: glutamine-hydrolyzing carbamoyl-phosphate synthase small subunit [Sphingobium]MBU0658133.1 glutamine-hydrolyzing carbamoyl-phosphate synthase small subunit [Alphaproteobacteria bacterium]MBA4755613.1 glutamine-hydrolyzing carbamoyl-phosphate synthase small subunit [Sphingobium sp.]MBS87568.1 carbamoyl-phosphate synthase small subunit [Sphingobium sp.]MBU0868363.1 glutamine-hydrolyzing carbamoyl-phosphate synthase small subunit [Alphaproteobacteria bacterium]MBU1794574.1 glutam
MADAKTLIVPKGATGVLVFADGSAVFGRGFGAVGEAVGELCFNTAITGYQEIMTDPSYAGQVVTFTFPHIGNVGTNADDVEADTPFALGCVVRQDVTEPSNFRNVQPFDAWMRDHGRIGLSGVDTRALTRMIREKGAPNIVIAHDPDGQFDIAALAAKAAAWPGLEGMDLAIEVTGKDSRLWNDGGWTLGAGYSHGEAGADRPHVVAIDYGAKNNIFRNLVKAGARVTVLPATATFDQVSALSPDGVFLSNGPGDPAATGAYAVPVIRQVLDADIPVFGICLGHQLLGLAVGAKTIKMHQGHRGANHPVKRLEDGLVEITSMNHGFAVDAATLPANVRATHVSLFDGSNCGIALTDKNAFSVQYHPEASPGPQDSFYLFQRFVDGLKKAVAA